MKQQIFKFFYITYRKIITTTYAEFKANSDVNVDVNVDYEKVYEYVMKQKELNPHEKLVKVGNNIVTCYNGKTCETLSFLKQDMLGLNTLSIIKDCLNLIGRDKFDFDYDLDDQKVYETINNSTLEKVSLV